MYFFVGSENPVKITAAKTAAGTVWPDLVVVGLGVPSGVPAQPRSDEQTRSGATARARNALLEGKKRLQLQDEEAALGLGLEGGVVTIESELWSTVWVVVTADGKEFYSANGARFKLPTVIAEPIMAGEEMGPVVGRLLANPEVKRQQGMIGVVTNNFVDRSEEYAALAKLAIGLWYGRDWQQTIVTKNSEDS